MSLASRHKSSSLIKRYDSFTSQCPSPSWDTQVKFTIFSHFLPFYQRLELFSQHSQPHATYRRVITRAPRPHLFHVTHCWLHGNKATLELDIWIQKPVAKRKTREKTKKKDNGGEKKESAFVPENARFPLKDQRISRLCSTNAK